MLKSVLSSPLPRVYELSDKGPLPTEKEASIVGSGVAFEVFATTGAELKSKLQQEVGPGGGERGARGQGRRAGEARNAYKGC